jgi:hypothetical protein
MRGCANTALQQSRATAQSDHFMWNIIADVVRLKPDTTDERGGREGRFC